MERRRQNVSFAGICLLIEVIYLWHNRQAITLIDSINAPVFFKLKHSLSLFSIFCHKVSFENLVANQLKRIDFTIVAIVFGERKSLTN